MQNVNTVRPRTDMAIYLPLVPTSRHRPDVSNTRRHQHRDDSRGDELCRLRITSPIDEGAEEENHWRVQL
jgi:hypothetical protein